MVKTRKWVVRVERQISTFADREEAKKHAKELLDAGLWFMELEEVKE